MAKTALDKWKERYSVKEESNNNTKNTNAPIVENRGGKQNENSASALDKWKEKYSVQEKSNNSSPRNLSDLFDDKPASVTGAGKGNYNEPFTEEDSKRLKKLRHRRWELDLENRRGDKTKYENEFDDVVAEIDALEKKEKNFKEAIKKANMQTAGGNKDSWFKSGAFYDGYDFGDGIKTVLGTAGDIGVNAVKGAGRLLEGLVDLGTYGVAGIADLFGAEDFAEKAKDVAIYSATDEWTKGITGYLDKYSVVGDKGDAIAEGLGQIAAIVGTGGIAGAAGLGGVGATALTTGVTGLSSMGTNMGEAYDAEATDGEAFLYGLGTGMLEAGTELLFGGLGKGVKALGISRGIGGLDDMFAKKISSKLVSGITDESVQRLLGNTIEFSIKSGGEGFEEVLAGLGSAAMKKITYMDNKDLTELIKDENLLDQFIVGTVASYIAQSPSYIKANKTGTDFVTGQTSNIESAVNDIAEKEIAKREDGDAKLNTIEKNRIYNEVTSNLAKAIKPVKNEVVDAIINDEESLNTLIEEGKASGEGTVSEKIATEIETAKKSGNVTREQVKRLIASNEVYIKAEEHAAEIQQKNTEREALEDTAREVVEKRQRGTPLEERLEAMSEANEPLDIEDVKKATRFGENGAKLVAELASNEGVTFNQAKSNVETAYFVGFTDLDSKQVNFVTETQINAFTAGKQDRLMKDTANRAAAKKASVYETGYVKNEFSENLSDTENEVMSVLAKDLKMDAKVVKDILVSIVNGKRYEANASHQDGKMRISSTAENAITGTAVHESFHRVKELAPDEFKTLANFIYNRTDAETQSAIYDLVKAEHDNVNVEMDPDSIIEEIAVREIEAMFDTPEKFFEFRNSLEANPQSKSAWQKIWETIIKVLEDIKAAITGSKLSLETKRKALAEADRLDALMKGAYKSAMTAAENRVSEVKNSQNDGEIDTSVDYNGSASHSLKDVKKTKRQTYNEYNTIGMQWAYSSSTKIGDLKVLYNAYAKKHVLVEATKDDIGFIELNFGTYDQMRKDLEIYEANKQGEYFDDERAIDTALHNFEIGQNNNARNNVDVGNRGKGIQNAEVSERKSESNRTRSPAKAEANNPKIDYSLKDSDDNAFSGEQQYTEKEYRNFGWARANNVLNAGQNADYRSKFADAKVGRAKFNKSKKGEYIIPVSDIYDPDFEGVNNVLVFVKGTITNPVIASVIEIYEYNETEIDRIRRQIYDGERRGIQQKTGELFGRYYSTDFVFQPNQQAKGAESVGNSSDNGYGRRSSEEASSVKEQPKVSYSLKNEWHTDLTKTQFEMVEGWLRRAGTPEAKKITDTAYWYKGRIGGEDLFVIYSAEDATGHTILYEVKGNNAKTELNILMDLLEEIENEKRTRTVGKSTYVNWVSGSGWLQKVDNNQNNQTNLGAGSNNKNVGVLQGQSKGNGSGAFWNVIGNLFGISNDRGISYSIKDSDYLELARNSKQNEAELQKSEQSDTTGNNEAVPMKRYSFAGYRAKNADKSLFKQAIDMKLDGIDQNEIFEKTGWYRGLDGLWRFEINDRDLEFFSNGDAIFAKENPQYFRYVKLYDKLSDGTISDREYNQYRKMYNIWEEDRRHFSSKAAEGKFKLSNVLYHPELFKAYPELNFINVRFIDLGTKKAEFSGDTISINSHLPKNLVKQSLLHEVQHAIQIVEGFALGSSVEYWEQTFPSGNAEKLYFNTAGEIEARQVEKRLDLTDSQRRKEMPFTGDENTVLLIDQYIPSETEDMVLNSENDQDTETPVPDKRTTEMDDNISDKFTYNALTSLPDMEVPYVDSKTDIKFTNDGKIDKAYIFKTVRDKCEQIITNKKEPTYVTEVPALGGKVEITGDGIKHGFNDGLKKGKKSVSAEITARAELMLPEVLKSSIEVNRLSSRGNIDVPYSSVLLGTVSMETDGKVEIYAVRSVVNIRSNQNPVLAEFDVIGSMYSANAKKIDTPNGWDVESDVARAHDVSMSISISQLLDSVKGVFDDTLSNDVYEYFDFERINSDFSQGLLFSLKGGLSGKDINEVRGAIDDMRGGKKGAADRLAKYVDKGVISTEQYDKLIEQYGAIPKGEKPSRNVSVPAKTTDDKKVSQTVRTILEAKATPDESVPTIEKMVEDGVFSYDVYTDKQAIKDAEDYIKAYGWDESLEDWFEDVEKGVVSKQITTMGWALYNNAANLTATTTSETERASATKTALNILDAMVRHQRSAAQALQATRILKKLSPETQLYGVQKSVQAFQKELTDRYGKKAPGLKIDEKLAEQFLEAQTEEERETVEKEIYKDIGRQVPSRFIDKWNAWRYLAMLGNPRTHIRNIVGNAGFAPLVLVKDLTATTIESVIYKLSGKKTVRGKSLIVGSKTDRALLKAAWSDYANVSDLVSNGGKYSDFAMKNQYIEEGRRIFKTKPLEWARKGNSKSLEVEDVWFSKPHYTFALAMYCKANNITPEQILRGKAIEPARQYAIKEAQKATYKDTNAFSQMVSDLGRKDSSPKSLPKKVLSTVIEGVLPFRKTPANILARGVEYSPVGLLKGLTYDLYKVAKGEMMAHEAIDNISAGLTGTALVALGVYLAAQGLVRGHGEDEEKEKDFKELTGHQNYALELPNGTSVTLDWLAPEALPFFVGVNVWEAAKSKKEEVTISTVLNAVTNITEPMMEMSCLQGLNDLFESVGYASSNDTSGLMSVLTSAVTSYLMQGIPTLFGQVERTNEDIRMTTYTENNNFFTVDMQYTFGRASAKIPGWDYQQIPYIDAWGRKEASGTALKRGLNNFLNPAYTSTIKDSSMEKELLRLYEQTGDGAVFPDRAKKYFTVDGVRKDLTADEYVRYATLKGEKSYKLIIELVESDAYKKLSDEEKVKAIVEAYAYADAKAKKAISDYKPDSWIEKADKFSDNVENYFSFRAEVSESKKANGNKISKQEAVDILAGMNAGDEEAWALYFSTYDDKGANYARDNGIKGNTYIDFLGILDEVDTPTESGKYGTYTQKEATSAVNKMTGLSRKEKAILWQSVNTTWKNNPFK